MRRPPRSALVPYTTLFRSRLVVVTPTLKAAKVAAAEVGAAAGSAAWLAFQHGWRWSGDGVWTRLAAGDADPRTGAVHTGPEDRQSTRLNSSHANISYAVFC